MKIDSLLQGKNPTTENLNSIRGHEASARIAGETSGYSLDISSKDKDITAFGMGELESFEDIARKASVKNVSLESDANAVMSNSMSEEDFAEYLEEGYSPSNMEVDEVVTNLDKIKAVLIESGVDIKGYTDTISDSEIEAIAGSQSLAGVIKNALSDNNLPVTEDNVQDIAEITDLSKKIAAPSDDTKKYLISNDMDITVYNLYKAEFSSAADNGSRASFYIDKTGYTSVKPKEADFEALKPQIEKIIKNENLPVNEETLNAAKWLLNKDIPVTGDNIVKLNDIDSVAFPLSEKQVVYTAAYAIADGIDVKAAELTKTESTISKAVGIKNEVLNYIDSIPEAEIKDRRLLEETRLHMTTEANLYLLKKGITIDTKNLEDLVSKLKEAEKEIYRPLLTDKKSEESISDDELTDRIGIYKETRSVLSEIKDVPIEAVAQSLFVDRELTLNTISNNGEELKASYIKADRAYETMMTAPRRDMGDSIKKAFRNVDDILDDLEITANEINEKAVRSLGYAGLEITEENVNTLAKANTAVENVISHMTPKKTLEFIRSGRNPLEEDLFQLSDELSLETEEESVEKYSEFLWKLEKKKEITEDEKASFIGLYRLFRKIEKSDGKLVGNVIKADDKLTLSNLLTASRSNASSGMDVSVDDKFGALEKLVQYGKSITDQILQGFKDKSTDAEFIKEETEEFRRALQTEDSVRQALESIDEPVTVNNMLAMDQLTNIKGTVFDKLLNKSGEKSDKNNRVKKASDKLIDGFTSKESADGFYEELITVTDEANKEAVDEADNYLDVKEMSLYGKQLSIASSMVKNNSYEVPVEVNGKYTTINLKIVKNSDETGKVSASFRTEEYGNVTAEFKVNSGKASGLVVTDSKSGSEAMREKEALLKKQLEGTSVSIQSIYYTVNKDTDYSIVDNTKGDSTPTKDLYELAKAFIEVMQQ